MGFNKVFHVKSEESLAEPADALADLAKTHRIMMLEGDLGAGKTALCRKLIRRLSGNAEQEVPSPTFTLVQTYTTPMGEIWHFDLYRLESPEEIYEIGWEDALSSAALILIEWPSRMGHLLPPDGLDIHITINPDKSRTIKVSA